jgi:outer membrane immunogenic protein
MKTVKISALVLAMAGVFATSANAQSAKKNAWEGAYGQVGVGWGMFVPSVSSGTAVQPTRAGNLNLTSSASNVNNVSTGLVNFAVGYNFGIDQNWLVGLGATYYPGASSGATGNLNYYLPNGAPLKTSPASYQVKNLYSIVLTPGYAIDKDRLAYAKIGYTGATIGLSTPDLAYNTNNLSGLALGLGYKQMITGSIYAFGEVNYAAYGNKTATGTTSTGATISNQIKGTGTDILVGVGYRF